jgi:hypothetical protein
MAADVYSVADRSATVTTAVRLAELRTTTATRIRIREIGVTVGIAGASPTIGLIRANALGVTPTSPKAGQPHDPSDVAGTASSAVAWGTPPTLPGTPIYLRRVTLPASLGAGWVWNFGPDDLVVAAGPNAILIDMVAISAATNTAIDFYIVWEE